MAKDPAFLFYSQDFLVGTMAMSFEDRGRYITLLCYMHQNGHISDETIRLLVGSCSVILMSKFQVDLDGFYYSKRLEIEVEKRKKFTESRKINGKLGGRPSNNQQVKPKQNLRKTDRLLVAKPTDNLIENENIYLIVEYLNKKVESKFKVDNKKTITLITNLLNQKYIVEDFKKVIDVKCSQWLNTEYNKYLRPETLFGSKFESYLNEKITTTVNGSTFMFSKKFHDTLNGKELSDYWRQLREHGYIAKKDHQGNVIDWVKQQTA